MTQPSTKRLLTEANASTTYGKTGFGKSLPQNNFAQLAAAIKDGKKSVGITVLGDSTGYTSGKTRWPDLLGTWLTTQFPGYAVQKLTWDGTSTYGTPTVLSGTPSARSVTTAATTPLLHPGYGVATGGNLDVRVKLSVPAWPVAASPTFVSRWGSGAGLNSWYFFSDSAGAIYLKWSTDGNATSIFSSSANVTIAANTPIWLRATLNVTSGAVAFYTSTDGATWTSAGGGTAGAGATSIFDPGTSQPYVLGGYSINNGMAATFYEVHVINGIAQLDTVPAFPDVWNAYRDQPGASGITLNGSPVLTLMNGSWPGSSIINHTDSTNLPRLSPLWHNPLVRILNLSHNDTTRTGPEYIAAWDSWLSSLKSRDALCSTVMTTQNPKIAGTAAYPDAHAARFSRLTGWAVKNGVTIIDAYTAFLNSTKALGVLVDPTDGIHPTDSDGSPLWAQTVENAILGIN